MKKLFIVSIIIALLASAGLAKDRDIVYLNDGSEHIGSLVKITEQEVILNMREGEVSFAVDSVRSIDIGSWRPGDDWDNRLDIDDPLLESALETADMASREWTSAGYITLYEKATLTVHEDLSADYVVRYIYYIANERGKDRANFSMNYYEDVQNVEVDFARSVGLASISTVADNAIEDGSTTAWLADYQRRRVKKFALTGASLGSVVDYQLTKHYDRFDQWNPLHENWTFYDNEPKIESIFEVKYHSSVPLMFHEVEVPKPKTGKEDNYSTREYRMENIEPYVSETMLPNLNWFMPNVTVTLPQDLQELSAAYYAKIVELSDAINLVESRLSAQYPSGNASVENVYNFVSENFSSNGVSIRDFYPYPNSLSVLLDRSRIASYEMDFVLYAFLKAAGHNPQLVLVGPGIDTKIPENMFNLDFFTSLAVKVDDNGVTRYISPNEYRRYDNQHLNGQFVLPVSEQGAKLVKIDRLPGDHHYTVPSYNCQLLPDGTLFLQYTEKHIGETGSDYFRYQKNRKPREIDNHFDAMAKNIDELAHIVDYKLEGHKNLSEEVDVSYRVEIPGFAVSAGEEILAFKLPTVNFSASQVGASERNLPFSRPGNSYSEKHITIRLPEGYEIEYIPKSVKFSVGYRTFEGKIEVENGILQYTQISEGKHSPMLAPKEYTKYKEFEEQRARFADNWILLRKI